MNHSKFVVSRFKNSNGTPAWRVSGWLHGVPALMRLWIACGTSWRIQREFECAVLEISRKTINPDQEGLFDDDCL